MPPSARSTKRCSTSMRSVSKPRIANICAIPVPIVPPPMTATLLSEGVLPATSAIYIASTASATALPPPRQSVASPATSPAVLHRVEERGEHARAARADRMPERDRAAVHVHARPVPAELLAVGERLRRERLVRLDQVERVRSSSRRFASELLHRDDRRVEDHPRAGRRRWRSRSRARSASRRCCFARRPDMTRAPPHRRSSPARSPPSPCPPSRTRGAASPSVSIDRVRAHALVRREALVSPFLPGIIDRHDLRPRTCLPSARAPPSDGDSSA